MTLDPLFENAVGSLEVHVSVFALSSGKEIGKTATLADRVCDE